MTGAPTRPTPSRSPASETTAARLRRGLAWTLGTWFGCGLSPVAPGTVGTLGAVPLYLAATRLGPFGVAIAAVLVTLAGVWAAGFVSRDLGQKDPSLVVVDEVAGYLVTMLPAGHVAWPTAAAGWALFRLFDITKPGPVRRLERLPGGWGIVLDDVAAGGLAALVLLGLRWAGVLPA